MKIGKTEKILIKSASKGPLCFTLLDSQSTPPNKLPDIIKTIEKSKAAAIFVGGSTISDQVEIETFVNKIKKLTKLPIILFPGNISGVASNADAILFMSLLNSDNPYFITGAQALGAISVKKHNIEPLPTAYIIVGEGGGAASFIGRAKGIPDNKPEIAGMYAMAAEFMGMRFLYLESGSGAKKHIPIKTIQTVRKLYSGFLMVGGGIKDEATAKKIAKTGVDAIVIGSLLETKNYKTTLPKITKAIRSK